MTDTITSLKVNALAAATAWLNAFLATGGDDSRPALYRTLSMEFFRGGVHFVGCDGTILLRTWVPSIDDDVAPWPEMEESPERAVVVMDPDKFAITFMRTLSTAVGEFRGAELVMSIEDAPESIEGAPLGDAFSSQRLTLRAFGQELHCRLYESEYPNWRKLQFGLDPAEQVEGMRIATRLFATIGKLKGVSSVDCTFLGEARQIQVLGVGEYEVRGLMMPMRRGKDAPSEAD